MNKLASKVMESYGKDEGAAPSEPGDSADLESEMSALGAALKSGDTKAAARAFKEAYKLC